MGANREDPVGCFFSIILGIVVTIIAINQSLSDVKKLKCGHTLKCKENASSFGPSFSKEQIWKHTLTSE